MRTLVLAGLLLAASGAMAASASPYPGMYRNDQIVIEVRDKGAGQYAGSISARGEVFRFTARETAGALVGSFTLDDESVRFHATLDGATPIFVMEDESYTLTREDGPRASATGRAAPAGKAASPGNAGVEGKPAPICNIFQPIA